MIDIISTNVLATWIAAYEVQPPPYCVGDDVELRLHLEHLSKLQCLYNLRRQLAKYGVIFETVKSLCNTAIEGKLLSWTTSASSSFIP